jgi:hypothetical protein
MAWMNTTNDVRSMAGAGNAGIPAARCCGTDLVSIDRVSGNPFDVLILAMAIASGVTQSSTPQSTSKPVAVYGATNPQPGAQGDGATESGAPDAIDTKSNEWVVAPIPMINPTLKNGLILMLGYLYRLDKSDLTTAPSYTMGMAFKTSNDSWGGAIAQSLRLAHDRFRVFAMWSYTDLNYGFYGIGQSAGDNGVSIDINQAGSVGLGEVLIRTWPRWYFGPRYQILTMSVGINGLNTPDTPKVPDTDGKLVTGSLGPHVKYDSRDNPFYPRHGVQVDAVANFYDAAFGGRRTYQTYKAAVNQYLSFNARNVLAWRVSVCSSSGDIPFYNMCMFASARDLRGYPGGQYRDLARLAGQIEWRSEIWWRLGGVIFAGAGEVAPDLSSLAISKALPSIGTGIRFTLAPKNHVNLRVDYAWGKNSSALYLSVAEAF